MTCKSCGKGVSEKLMTKYKKHNLETEHRYCEECIRSFPRTIFSELFGKIKDTLGEKNQEEWKDLELWLKSGFALQMIQKGYIEGGTMGHRETLRAITASEVE